jgi:hypothetical protein
VKFSIEDVRNPVLLERLLKQLVQQAATTQEEVSRVRQVQITTNKRVEQAVEDQRALRGTPRTIEALPGRTQDAQRGLAVRYDTDPDVTLGWEDGELILVAGVLKAYDATTQSWVAV